MRRPIVGTAAAGLLLALAACQSGAATGKVQGTDAELACAAVHRLPDPMPDSKADGEQAFDIALARLAGAEELARAAALADAKFQPLADALREAQQQISVTFDAHQAEPAVKKARTYC
ncbi:hypothetical protein ACFRKE_36725 [Kitasatospora indigofera]|uniref:Lipoprotein n=1 Tax=Kitasatospora indigofera TaxID=67307 RepID=A0A919G107_9ACTN|nr:hypothetical protein [Kitasatospora indigofera]GHH75210.1 hypothetical protein GCM10018781_43570 [Kitasatospora indigofera]